MGRGSSPRNGDAFGMVLADTFAEICSGHMVERDDGFVEVLDAAVYFQGPDGWPAEDVAALERVAGRVLDVGAGAGRHSLALQERGAEPVALDVSPGAIAVCRERGVDRTYLGSVDAFADERPEPFDAIMLMGNNLALLESVDRSTAMLATLNRLLAPGGTVVGTCLDPYLIDDPDHLAYHQWNRRRGRLAGQIRMRIRYRTVATGWFDYLFVSPEELGQLAAAAGWHVAEVTEPTPTYMAVLRPNRS